ncbi:anchored repeat ABC transporter, substrate-binding protein [Gulosibacter sp. 10]|uniref:anchored repeat ABC transporter, substrate-binding protein n=1 Tax=Gulosibacter sp. 10 TaxID=1255570 RepID=UPI0020CFE3DA|nr:anchored repeat ABC transporter, substrate-binding protein [Gulosibacter sp. 10]
MNRIRAAAGLAVSSALVLTGCSAAGLSASPNDDRINVVTTTGILADLVENVGGDRVDVVSLVPEGGDPHSYDPSLRDIRDVVYADVAFTNYLMLEEQALINAIDANLPASAANVALAEEAVQYAANIIPLVEDVSLDTIWLGLRAEGGGEIGLERGARVELSADTLEGPGALHAYLTGSFGDIDHYFDSTDGLRGDSEDTVGLPADAHTHLSWAFSEPGIYELDLTARLRPQQTDAAQEVASGTIVFAVGVDPYSVPARPGATVLDSGHADISVDLANDELTLLHDRDPKGRHDHSGRDYHPLDEVVVSVPNAALHEVPPDPAYNFLRTNGQQVYQLAQAVLGKHVHGEIDPHLWHDVSNAQAYVQIIRDTLIEKDPQHAADYMRNTEAYLAELDALDEEVRTTLAEIPESRRTLITTHDSFGYLASAYDMQIAGFVSPNPAVEPSLTERMRLTETIRNLDVPAVFLEPNLAQRASTLQEVADDAGIEVCPILGDAFSPEANTYIEFMRFNANSLRDCLGGGG